MEWMTDDYDRDLVVALANITSAYPDTGQGYK